MIRVPEEIRLKTGFQEFVTSACKFKRVLQNVRFQPKIAPRLTSVTNSNVIILKYPLLIFERLIIIRLFKLTRQNL